MRVVIAGENPFVDEVAAVCRQAGHDLAIYLVEDFMSAIQSGYDIPNITHAEVVLELHNESAATKRELLAVLADIVPQNALVLTSALACSTTQAASWIPRPERVVGFGLMPPLGETGMVELARGILTNDKALATAQTFWQSINYTPVEVGDGAGLVRGRVICSIINEAVTALQAGVASAQDIDTAMKLGTNYPHGPLEWADHLGLDTVLGVMTGLFEEWGEDRYRPAPLLKRMVLAGQLGKKSGQGFYTHGQTG